MADKRIFYVGTRFGPDHNQPERRHVGAKAAIQAAQKQGCPCTVYLFDGRQKHWHLIVDYSTRYLAIVGNDPVGRPMMQSEKDSLNDLVSTCHVANGRAWA